MDRVRVNHVLCLLLDVERVLEHVEDEREVEVSEIGEVLKLLLIRPIEVVIEQITVVPRVIRVCSSDSEKEVPKFGYFSLSGGDKGPLM